MSAATIDPLKVRNRIHPQLFGLYIAFASIMMMFAALTSAYIVKHAQGDWLEYAMPSQFYMSTAILLLSSVTLHVSYSSFLKNREQPYKIMLVLSLILGLAFVVLQYQGWVSLFNVGVDLKANVSGSFLYLITGLHALHILGGIAAIIVALIHAYTLPFIVTAKRRDRFKLVLHYWHFVDFLWIYLLAFLLLVK